MQAQGPAPTLAALTNPRQPTVILAGEKFTETYLRGVFLGLVPDDVAGLAGCSVTQAAERDSQPPGEWVLDLLVHARLNVGGHLDRPALTEEDLTWLASSDRHCAGSDGIYRASIPTRADTPPSHASPGTTSQPTLAPGTSSSHAT